MPYLTVNDSRFFYQQQGEGPDVILIHAVTSNLAVWMFINILETLGKNFRVTAYDLKGHGGSDVPETGYTSADMAADLKQLHGHLGLGPAYLVGHSFGGVIAMHAAAEYPEIVSGVIVSDSYFPGLAHIEPNPGHTDLWQELRTTFASVGEDLGEELDFGRLFQIVGDLTQEKKERLKKEMGPSSMRWLAQLPMLAQTTCGNDVMAVAGLTEERICSIRQPVVALYDENSPFQATCQFLQERLPNCVTEIIPGASHIAPLQNSTDFVEVVRKHLLAMHNTSEECTSVLHEPSAERTKT